LAFEKDEDSDEGAEDSSDEGHASVSDCEDFGGVGEVVWELVDEYFSESSTQQSADNDCEDEVVEFGGENFNDEVGWITVKSDEVFFEDFAYMSESEVADEEADEVHNTVSIDSERSDREGYHGFAERLKSNV